MNPISSTIVQREKHSYLFCKISFGGVAGLRGNHDKRCNRYRLRCWGGTALVEPSLVSMYLDTGLTVESTDFAKEATGWISH